MAWPEAAEARRRQILRPALFRLWLVRHLPLAAAAGLSLLRLDEEACEVRLPGGWRTQNPFRSTYFAAQAMAAEMSTGAPASLAVLGHQASVAMLVTGLEARFTRKIVGPSVFRFDGVQPLREAVARAASSTEAATYVAHSVGRAADGTPAAEFEVTWSFKARSRA